MELEERAEAYNKAFKKWPASHLHTQGNFIVGVWMIGNCYRNASNLYGAYPHGYLKRIMSMFPDLQKTIHLFSGSLTSDDVKGIRVDINPKMDPDYVIDAHKLSEHFSKNSFDGIFADPAYSNEDSLRYGTPMINRNRVLKECVKILQPGGFLVWLDQVYPMYRKDELKLVGTIGLIRSTNHRVRFVFIYQRGKKDEN